MTKKRTKVLEFDGKAAAAGDLEELGTAPDGSGREAEDRVFDGLLNDAAAIEMLVELNHQRTECAVRWEDAKSEAQEAKKELDNASNAISALIDRIDRQRSGVDSAQPVLRTLEEQANPQSLS